jgi:hypothetical protein
MRESGTGEPTIEGYRAIGVEVPNMRRDRPRWRIRINNLMALVAVMAGAMTCCEMQRRRRAYRAQAWYHLAASHQIAIDSRWSPCTFGSPKQRAEAIQASRLAERTALLTACEYHLRLHAKYERAAQRPWLPVALDSLPPPGGNPALLTANDY